MFLSFFVQLERKKGRNCVSDISNLNIPIKKSKKIKGVDEKRERERVRKRRKRKREQELR